MTTRFGLNNLDLYVNNEHIAYKPNSLSFCDGKGEYKVRAFTTGGGGVDIIVTEDSETKIGKVKFIVESSPYMDELVRSWKSSRDTLFIQLVERDGEFSRSFPALVLITDPEVKATVDGEIDLEFQGQPSI